MMVKNIIFDFDGTVVDSAKDIIKCLKLAYSVIPRYLTVSIDKKFIGPPLAEMIKLITPDIKDEEKEIIIKEFRKCYDNCDFSNTLLFPGVRELLDRLYIIGVRIFLVTNKPILPTRRILEKLLINYFTDIVTSDTGPNKNISKEEMIAYLIEKWRLEREKTLLIGDSASDINAAHKNGIAAAGILNGYGSRDEIVGSRPEYICNNIFEINRLFGGDEN